LKGLKNTRISNTKRIHAPPGVPHHKRSPSPAAAAAASLCGSGNSAAAAAAADAEAATVRLPRRRRLVVLLLVLVLVLVLVLLQPCKSGRRSGDCAAAAGVTAAAAARCAGEPPHRKAALWCAEIRNCCIACRLAGSKCLHGVLCRCMLSKRGRRCLKEKITPLAQGYGPWWTFV
jgi:hypothetical protein